jgi:hypothetical protein
MDSYQYKNIYGLRHVVYPHDKGYVVKRILKSGVRSATEQYEIHKIACDFKHELLRAPCVGELLDSKSYSMEQIYEYHKLHPFILDMYPPLKEALRAYSDYMKSHGYFPYGYTILISDLKFIIIDFSQYGSIQGDRVYFKHLKRILPLSVGQELYDTPSYMNIIFMKEDEN